MRTFDLSPLFRTSVGFDNLTNWVDTAFGNDNRPSYPPYNIELVDTDKYRVTMAVAGFNQSEIDIVAEHNSLVVTGRQAGTEEKKYLYQGIGARNFERKFRLADHVKVASAKLENGLLLIDLEREIPEAMKPRKIEIKSARADLISEKAA